MAELTDIWQAFRAGTPVRAIASGLGPDASPPGGPEGLFYLAVLAFSRGEDEVAARTAALAAAAAPAEPLYGFAAGHLAAARETGRRDVYRSPEGFAAFIRGGGNRALYRALGDALRDRYRRHRPARLLDVGTGDGLALLPALTGDVGHVDAVEPSAAMLATVAAGLRRREVAHTATPLTVQRLVAGEGPWPPGRRWDLAQSTFALHAVAPDDRREALRWLRRRADRLLIAEFDVPAHESCEPAWFRHVHDRYRAGLAEYTGADAGLVAREFLLPVLFGYFDPAAPHHEQPIAAWADDLRAAGFATVLDPVPLHDYWWAPAVLVEAC